MVNPICLLGVLPLFSQGFPLRSNKLHPLLRVCPCKKHPAFFIPVIWAGRSTYPNLKIIKRRKKYETLNARVGGKI